MELGNHAEFLGRHVLHRHARDVLHHDGGDTQKWRLKGHAENEFWKWMASWAVMLRKPSDLGYANDGYDLPPLIQHQHIVGVDYAPSLDTGLLFPMEARRCRAHRARAIHVDERVAMAATITPPIGRSSGGATSTPRARRWRKAIPGAVETGSTATTTRSAS
jgi:hypothetical protein